MKTKKIRTIIFLIVIINLSGCTSVKKQEDLYVGVMFRTILNPYFEEIERGIRESASLYKIKAIVVASDRFEGKQQEEIFQKLVRLKIKTLIIMPEVQELAEKNCIPLIIEANRLNIPVILIHASIEEQALDKADARVTCKILCDNIKGGSLAGQYIADKINQKGEVLLLEGDLSGYPGRRREEGFLKVMKKYPNIKIIKGPPADWDREKAFQVVREIFSKNPDIKGVFAFNDSMALGVADAVEFTKVKKPLIVGFNGTPQAIKAIREGRIDATVNQNPYEIGKISIETTIKLCNGETVAPQILINPNLTTKETLQMPFK